MNTPTQPHTYTDFKSIEEGIDDVSNNFRQWFGKIIFSLHCIIQQGSMWETKVCRSRLSERSDYGILFSICPYAYIDFFFISHIEMVDDF